MFLPTPSDDVPALWPKSVNLNGGFVSKQGIQEITISMGTYIVGNVGMAQNRLKIQCLILGGSSHLVSRL